MRPHTRTRLVHLSPASFTSPALFTSFPPLSPLSRLLHLSPVSCTSPLAPLSPAHSMRHLLPSCTCCATASTHMPPLWLWQDQWYFTSVVFQALMHACTHDHMHTCQDQRYWKHSCTAFLTAAPLDRRSGAAAGETLGSGERRVGGESEPSPQSKSPTDPIAFQAPPWPGGGGTCRPLPGGRFAASNDSTPSQGRGWVYVSPGCFAHPGGRAFWLGGGCRGGQLSEGRRA